MASSPSHRFGQIIGDLLEEIMEPQFQVFCNERGLYLDKKGTRGEARDGKKVTWLDKYGNTHDLGKGVKADNVGDLHAPFLAEARRVLKPDGLVFAKIKDYVHNHRYQWNLELFNAAVREAGMTPCDLIIKRDPCGGNLKSGRWQRAHHAKNTHCFWVVVRNSKRCEPKAPNTR